MTLIDGPLEGREIRQPLWCCTLVLPEVDGDGCHFISHHYTANGCWLHSETYVGYESDETRAAREAFWESEYWESIGRESAGSFT